MSEPLVLRLPTISEPRRRHSDGTMGHPSQSKSRKRQRTTDADALQCQVCFRRYERLDHLSRHLDTRKSFNPHLAGV